MLSLKRLLNEDSSEERQSGRLVRDFQYYPTIDETPPVTDQPLPEIWNGFLNPDVTDDSFVFDANNLNDSMGFGDQDSIDAWAEQFALEDPASNELPFFDSAATSSGNTDTTIMCYGMLYRIAVKVIGNMLEVDTKLKKDGQTRVNGQHIFGVRKDIDKMTLTFADGTDFGILNEHASKILGKLIDQSRVDLDCLAPTLTLRETIEKASKAKDAVVRVDINVYGASSNRQDVGRYLSDNKLYLQRPDQVRPGLEYDNPHILHFSDMAAETFEYAPEPCVNDKPTSKSTEAFRQTISDVYSSLQRGSRLNCMEGDARVKTDLLPHQKEALTYMTQREDGPISPEFCLWKAVQDDVGGWYRHAITNAKTRIQQPETGGGILADEMGMGKSLSILALITKTLDNASRWANEPKLSPPAADVLENRSQATLVIVPSAILINQWLDEVQIHLEEGLAAIKYHGQGRKDMVSAIGNVNIVLTTYHTLVADHNEKKSPLYDVVWYRVVLDEAHMIRRQATTFFRAVSELKARSRWCLTGTPIQNRLEDIGALFAFIRARPFDNMAIFRRFVAIPFDESEERRKLAVRNLTLLMESLCLRRTKILLNLPERQDRIRMVEFSPKEYEQYERTKLAMNRALRHRVGEEFTKSKFGMFQIQLQLRILCNHGTYQPEFSWTRRSLLDEKENAICSMGSRSEVRCSACSLSISMLDSDNLYRSYTAKCIHIMCSECLDQTGQLSEDEPSKCPLCMISGESGLDSSALTGKAFHDSYLLKEGHSSKMDALIEDVRKDIETTKSVIFSCWTNTLNLVMKYLKINAIPFERIDGECPLPRRQKILDDFSKSPDIPVLIMTTGTGAFGLNLTSANRVFIIEPQWNPSVENQAIARAIRLQQRNSVLVTRYMVRGTVEQEMRSQQERKLMFAELGNNTSSQ